MFGRKKCVKCGLNEASLCHTCVNDLVNENVNMQIKLYESPEAVKSVIKENEILKDCLESARRYLDAIKRYTDYLEDELNEAKDLK